MIDFHTELYLVQLLKYIYCLYSSKQVSYLLNHCPVSCCVSEPSGKDTWVSDVVPQGSVYRYAYRDRRHQVQLGLSYSYEFLLVLACMSTSERRRKRHIARRTDEGDCNFARSRRRGFQLHMGAADHQDPSFQSWLELLLPWACRNKTIQREHQVCQREQ